VAALKKLLQGGIAAIHNWKWWLVFVLALSYSLPPDRAYEELLRGRLTIEHVPPPSLAVATKSEMNSDRFRNYNRERQ